MAITKASTVVANNTTLTAGAGATTSATQDITGAYRSTVRVRLTNGATGPTVPAQCSIQISEDTTAGNFIEHTLVVGTSVNSDVNEFVIELPDTALQLRFVSGSNTGQNVTLRIVVDKITAI